MADEAPLGALSLIAAIDYHWIVGLRDWGSIYGS
ncbi:hypothetical protein MLPF_2849 [Mycobacterium lepromatosis]|nr:hypothetical protein MLPF_2849 [Mycobacterium lepromatosis]